MANLKRARELLLEKNITQAQLAQATGYSLNGLNLALDNGTMKLIAVEKMAKFFKVSVMEFIDDPYPPPPPSTGIPYTKYIDTLEELNDTREKLNELQDKFIKYGKSETKANGD